MANQQTTEQLLATLTPQEREIALKALSEISKGENKILETLKYADYEEIPVDIETFLYDKQYLGNGLIDPDGRFTVFPYWVETLKKIFPNNLDTKYNTLVLTGSIGIGKSFIAVLCMLYLLHRMLCLKDPYLHYGLQPIDKITFSLINVTIDAAKGVAWDKLQQLVQASPWFMSHGTVTGRSELTWSPNKRIELVVGSNNNAVIGRAVFCLDGDTIIKTTEGDRKLVDLVNKSIKVFSIDENGNQVVGDQCTVQPTLLTDEEYQIELEDGTVIKCTPNHKLMLKDGTYKEARYLTDGDELADPCLDEYDQFIANIIQKRGQWGIENNYFEGHHILPKCLGGEGRSKQHHPNIIRLYPEEHYIAHKLLLEKYPDCDALKFAFFRMGLQNKSKYLLPEEEYANLKRCLSEFFKGRTYSEETRMRMSKSARQRFEKERGPAFGKKAINNGTTCRYIDVGMEVPAGWQLGNLSTGKHPKHTVHKKHVIRDLETFRKQKSAQCSGSGNNMYGKGYKIAGGNNGKAVTRYFFKDRVFECRKDLVTYLNSIGVSITTSAVRTLESGGYGDLFSRRYKEVIDNLRWEKK